MMLDVLVLPYVRRFPRDWYKFEIEPPQPIVTLPTSTWPSDHSDGVL